MKIIGAALAFTTGFCLGCAVTMPSNANLWRFVLAEGIADVWFLIEITCERQ